MNKLFILICTILLFVSCAYDKEDLLYPGAAFDCNLSPSKFNTDIKPIMLASCATAGCHNVADAAAGVVLETYDQVNAFADRINQRAVVEKTMPVAGPLSNTEIDKISCWINQGTPNN